MFNFDNPSLQINLQQNLKNSCVTSLEYHQVANTYFEQHINYVVRQN